MPRRTLHATPRTTDDNLGRLSVEIERLRQGLVRDGRPTPAVVELARVVDELRAA